MSLFPAYASNNQEPTIKFDNTEEWLTNSSYQIQTSSSKIQNEPENISSCSSESGEEIKSRVCSTSSVKSKKRKLKKSHSPERTEIYKVVKCTDDFTKNLEGDFGVDKKPQRVYLSIKTIARPAAPKYHHSKYRMLVKSKKYFSKKQRYFNKLKKLKTDNTEQDNVNKLNQEHITNEEGKIHQKTSYYNQELGRNRFNIELWLEYIKFQDSVREFENTYRKGSLVKSVKATAERKLSIVEKALVHNPGNIPLIRERLKICQTIYPTDELSKYLKKLVDKEPGKYKL